MFSTVVQVVVLNSFVDRLGFVVVGEWRDRGTTEAIVLVVFCLLFFWHQVGEPRALQVAVPACSFDHLLQLNTVPSTAAPSLCFLCPTHETIKCRFAAQLEVGC